MSGQPPERKLAKFLGTFSFGLAVTQLVSPERVNKLIGVRDTPKTRLIQRAVGVQELMTAQGIFAFSPPTPVLWMRVAGDVAHVGMLGRALGERRNQKRRVLRTIGAVGALTLIDAFVSARYQAAWPKEPTQGKRIQGTRADEERIDAHVEGNPAITILATEAQIRPKVQEFDIASYGEIAFRTAPAGRGTEVVVHTSKRTAKVKAELRRVKQLIEVGEIVRSDAAPEGGEAKRQLWQRPARPLKEKQHPKAGGRS